MYLNALKAAWTGDYQTVGRIEDGDCVIGQAFGTHKDRSGISNQQLSDYIIDRVGVERPLMLQHQIAGTLPAGVEPALIFDGDGSTTTGAGLTSFNVLLQAKRYMQANGLERPIIVAHSNQVGRLNMQASHLAMNHVIPPDLPGDFDPDSEQWWTTRRGLWFPREALGMLALKIRGQI